MNSETKRVVAVTTEENSPRKPATSTSVPKAAATASLKGNTTMKKRADTKSTARAASRASR